MQGLTAVRTAGPALGAHRAGGGAAGRPGYPANPAPRNAPRALPPAWVGLLVFLTACAAFQERRAAPVPDAALETCLAPEALASRAPEEKERCIRLLERHVAERGADPSSERAVLQLGRFYMERGDFQAARGLLLSFSERYPGSREAGLARLYLGICLYRLDDPRGSLEVLHRLAEDPAAAPLRGQAGLYIAENYLKLGQILAALTWFERCDPGPRDPEARRVLQERVLAVVSREGDGETYAQAEPLFPAGFFHEAVRLGAAAAALRSGQPVAAENRLKAMALLHPDDLFAPLIQALLDAAGRQVRADVCTVGCLLPLSGRYGRFGRGILDALVLAAGAFRDAEGGRTAVRLLVRDTEGDRDTAVRHLAELADNPDVVGVIGPLLLPVSRACAVEAQKAGLPMISLSQGEDVALAGEYVFQNGLTMRQQVENLVGYAMEDLGVTRFAVLFPDDEFGAAARDAYRVEVLEAGGRVVAEVSYKREETDFQHAIRALLGERYWREMKLREEEEKRREALLRRSRTGRPARPDPEAFADPAGERPPLVTPFQALFVPDQHRKASLIAPYLAFYDLNDVVLLGNSAWNSLQLVRDAGEYVRDAVFVDGFFAESQMPHVRRFVDEFEEAFGRKPRTLEAQGYDSLLLLEEAFLEARPKTRARVREALARTAGYPGVSGATSFDEHGRASKRLYLLTVRRNRIEEIPGR